MDYMLQIDTLNENHQWTPPSLGKSSIGTWFQPRWMAAINYNHKYGCHGSIIQDRLAMKTEFWSIFNLTMFLVILDDNFS